MTPARLTRRQALAGAGIGALGVSLAAAGCGVGGRAPAASGSTRETTWGDPVGDGQLRVGPGERLSLRTELGPSAASTETLLTVAHLTDAHVLDAASPARVTFLDRLGAPFQSTFRPQETLTAQVLAGAVRATRALSPDLVVQGGDLIDNDQANELARALAVLAGAIVRPSSGPRGYDGVQLAADIDPFYYRPALDAPRHPTLLRDAIRPFRGPGVNAPVLPVFGDHDGLVAGTLLPTPLTRALALGDRALWDLPTGLTLPEGLRAESSGSPDGPPVPGAIDALLAQALAGPTVRIGPDPRRRQLTFGETVAALTAPGRSARGVTARDGRLDYVVDHGDRVRIVVLDLTRRDGGSGGEVVPGQADWLAGQLTAAGDRWVLVVSHQPIVGAQAGDEIEAVLARSPRVVLTLNGHIHRNAIIPRPTPAGGYWTVSTASLIDYPQQGRALALDATADGGVAIRTWMLDHVDHLDAGSGPGGPALGRTARALAYLDAQGGRPQGFAGAAGDRNAILHRRPV